MSLSLPMIETHQCIVKRLRGVSTLKCKALLFRWGPASVRVASSTAAVADPRPSPLHLESENSRHSWDKLSDRTRGLAEALLEENPATRTCGFDSSRLASEKPSSWWRHRVALSQAITLAESQSLTRQDQAGWLLTYLLHQPIAQRRRHQSFRLGIAGTSAELAAFRLHVF